MEKLRDKPYSVRDVGNGRALVTGIPKRWGAANGWKPGGLVNVGYENGCMIISKKKDMANICGTYKIGANSTIIIPQLTQSALDIKEGTKLYAYVEEGIKSRLVYKTS